MKFKLKNICSIIIVLVFFSYLKAQDTLLIGETYVQIDTLYTGLDVPWEIKYADDGYLWFTERIGRVSRINTSTGVKEDLLDISGNVLQNLESGLLGMELHPNFEEHPEVFLAYTYAPFVGVTERIVKYTFNGTALVNEETLLDGIIGNSTHNGCRLLILPDTTMLLSTGDAQDLSTPQDTGSLNGKILRLNLDGTIPADNPFPNNPVYSYGLRNTQGIALLPDGKIMISEHGPATDDEVQLLLKGRNYGWPNVEGVCNTPAEVTFCTDNDVVEPLIAYTPTIAPSDLIYYENENFPEFHQAVLMTVLKDKELRVLKFNSDFTEVVSDSAYFENLFGRLRDVAIGGNKEIYLATNGQSWSNSDPNTHSIVKLTPLTESVEVSIQNEKNKHLSLYPNPASNKVFLNFDGENKALNIKIYNSIGSMISNQIVEENQSIDVSTLANGSFYLEVELGDNTKVAQKLLIAR